MCNNEVRFLKCNPYLEQSWMPHFLAAVSGLQEGEGPSFYFNPLSHSEAGVSFCACLVLSDKVSQAHHTKKTEHEDEQ